MAQTGKHPIEQHRVAQPLLPTVRPSAGAGNLRWRLVSLGLPFMGAVLGVTIGTTIVMADRSPVAAQSSTLPSAIDQAALNRPSPELSALLAGKPLVGVVTSRTPSPILLSVPSLWWISDQLAVLDPYGAKFIQEWIAYPQLQTQPGQIDLLVNRQQWSLLDYLQRYSFVSKFSATARSYGYNLRIYDNPERFPIASYTCDYSPADLKVLQASAPLVPLSQLSTTIAVQSEVANSLTCDLNVIGLLNLLRR